MAWTPEPTYPKPHISVRATTIYYEIMAPLMLPFLSGRLLNLFRCRQDKCFFQRSRAHPPSGSDFKSPVHFESVEQKNGRTEEYLYVTDAQGIVSCAKAQTVEFHGWGSRAGAVETPDRLVIDLDPDPEIGFDAVKDAALLLRRAFELLELESFALLSGGKGIHVVVPLLPRAEWSQLRAFAHAFCRTLAEAHPKLFTVALPKKERRGRIFLDFLRNQRTATAIMPYSARARDGAPVAAPVAWEEVGDLADANTFTIADAELLIERSERPDLRGWGIAEQGLPVF